MIVGAIAVQKKRKLLWKLGTELANLLDGIVILILVDAVKTVTRPKKLSTTSFGGSEVKQKEKEAL